MTVPRRYPELSTRTVLTMQFFKGLPIRKLTPKSPEAQAVVNEIVHAALKQVFVDGMFHGDPHAELALRRGRHRLHDRPRHGRGVAGAARRHRHADDRHHLERRHDDCAPAAQDGTPTQRVNLAELKSNIQRIRSKHLVVENFGQYDSAGFIAEFGKAAGRYRIKLARDVAILAKAAATLEDIIRTLHSEVDLVGIARPFLDDIVEAAGSPPQRILGDMMSEASGIGSMLRTVPGQIDQLMHDFETGNIMVRAVTPELDRDRGICTRSADDCRSPGLRRQPPLPRRSQCLRPRSLRCAWSRLSCSRWQRLQAGPGCSPGTGSVPASR